MQPPRKCGGRPRTVVPSPNQELASDASSLSKEGETTSHGDAGPSNFSTQEWHKDHCSKSGGLRHDYGNGSGAIMYGSDDELESEEETPVHPMDRRASVVGLGSFVTARKPVPFSLPPISLLWKGTNEGELIEQMQLEMDVLRRQSAEAVSLSLRLSEQLAHVQEESSKMRTALKEVEVSLEDESKRRTKAEKMANDEERRRKKAEGELNELLISFGSVNKQM